MRDARVRTRIVNGCRLFARRYRRRRRRRRRSIMYLDERKHRKHRWKCHVNDDEFSPGGGRDQQVRHDDACVRHVASSVRLPPHATTWLQRRGTQTRHASTTHDLQNKLHAHPCSRLLCLILNVHCIMAINVA